MIEDVVFSLADEFPQYDWDLYKFSEKCDLYIILVNDFDFYMNSEELKNSLQSLRKRYADVKFTAAYKNFKY